MPRMRLVLAVVAGGASVVAALAWPRTAPPTSPPSTSPQRAALRSEGTPAASPVAAAAVATSPVAAGGTGAPGLALPTSGAPAEPDPLEGLPPEDMEWVLDAVERTEQARALSSDDRRELTAQLASVRMHAVLERTEPLAVPPEDAP